jgi:hypothetical protein
MKAFNDFAAGPKNMDQRTVPQGDRCAILSPADYWAMAGSQTALFSQRSTTNPTVKVGLGWSAASTPICRRTRRSSPPAPAAALLLVNGAAQNTTYDLTGANTQTLITNGWTAAAAARVVVGDTFTIAGVFDVNPVTKATLPILKQFVVAPARPWHRTAPAT